MKFTAFERSKQGTGASRRLRNAGKCPGIVYGGGEDPQNIELDHNALWYALLDEKFHSSILEMDLNGSTSSVFLRDVQYHPYKQQVLHVDFQRVNAGEAINMSIPIHFQGEETSPSVKLHGQLVNLVRNEVSVQCLPKDLPEFVVVDLSTLEKDAVVHISDIQLPEGVETYGYNDTDPTIVTTSTPRGAGSADEETTDDAAAGAGDADAASAE